MIPLFTEEEFQAAKSRQLLPLQCKHCGKTFYKEKHRIQNTKKGETSEYCSLICFGQSVHPPIFINCEQCSKKFKIQISRIKKSKHHFCSQSCSATYNNMHKTKGTKISKLERWLETKLPILYPNLEFHFNRKDAINSELDIYIPSLKLAFELNGIFHYEPIYGEDKLSKIQNNDNRKCQACHERNIELCIIDVSTFQHFKEGKAMKFLKIIQDIILLKISRIASDSIGETT